MPIPSDADMPGAVDCHRTTYEISPGDPADSAAASASLAVLATIAVIRTSHTTGR